MNKLSLEVKKISEKEDFILDGINFNNTILVNLLIDNQPSFKLKFLNLALVVFSELVRSLSGNGRYLIFTSASGIADEGGWEGVDIKYEGSLIVWDFEIEDLTYHFEFDQKQYESEIRSLEDKLSQLTEEIEPSGVFFPESWDLI